MPYTLIYHPQVPEADLRNVPVNVQHRIARAIDARLRSGPERYGTPLKGTLKRYWKLRVGDYRVVYKIARTEVWILAILHRREVYTGILPRIDWHPS